MPKKKPKYRDHLLPLSKENHAAFLSLLPAKEKICKLDMKYARLSENKIFEDLKL